MTTAEVVNLLAYRQQRRRDDSNTANANLIMLPFRAWIAYAVMGAMLCDIWQDDMRAL